MSPPIFIFVVVVVIGLPVTLGIGSEVFKTWVRHRERMAETLSADTAERAARYAANNERLEQRVAVLERILTDRSTHLADEIERLRDQPLN